MIERRCVCALVLLGVLLFQPAIVSASDEFIAGYASAILQHEFNVADASVEVRDGHVVVTTKTLETVDQGKVTSAIKQIPGVTRVELRSAEPSSPPLLEEPVQTTIPE